MSDSVRKPEVRYSPIIFENFFWKQETSCVCLYDKSCPHQDNYTPLTGLFYETVSYLREFSRYVAVFCETVLTVVLIHGFHLCSLPGITQS